MVGTTDDPVEKRMIRLCYTSREPQNYVNVARRFTVQAVLWINNPTCAGSKANSFNKLKPS